MIASNYYCEHWARNYIITSQALQQILTLGEGSTPVLQVRRWSRDTNLSFRGGLAANSRVSDSWWLVWLMQQDVMGRQSRVTALAWNSQGPRLFVFPLRHSVCWLLSLDSSLPCGCWNTSRKKEKGQGDKNPASWGHLSQLKVSPEFIPAFSHLMAGTCFTATQSAQSPGNCIFISIKIPKWDSFSKDKERIIRQVTILSVTSRLDSRVTQFQNPCHFAKRCVCVCVCV